MKLFILCIVFCVVICVTPFLVDNQGYIFINFANYTIELSVVVAICILLFVFVLMQIIFILLSKIWSVKKSITKLVDGHRDSVLQNSLTKGLKYLLTKDYEMALPYFSKNLHKSKQTSYTHLLAAITAAKIGEQKIFEKNINAAIKLDSSIKNIAPIVSSYFYEKKNDLKRASEELNKFCIKHTENRAIIIKMISQLIDCDDNEKIGFWLNEVDLKNIDEKIYYLSLEKYYNNILKNVNQVNDVEVCWDKLSKSLRKEPMIVKVFVSKLSKLNEQSFCEKIVLNSIKLIGNDILDFICDIEIALPKVREKLEKKVSKGDTNISIQRFIAGQLIYERRFEEAKIVLNKLLENSNNIKKNIDFKLLSKCFEEEHLYRDALISIKNSIESP